jgi:hypothetical protein
VSELCIVHERSSCPLTGRVDMPRLNELEKTVCGRLCSFAPDTWSNEECGVNYSTSNSTPVNVRTASEDK